MKNTLFIFLLAIMAISCGGPSATDMLNNLNDQMQNELNNLETEDDGVSPKVFNNAVRYNDFIINNQVNVYNKIVKLVNCLETCDDVELKKTYDEMGDEAKKSLKEVKRLSDFNGNTEFRDRANELFEFYVEIYEKSYKELIDMIIKGNITAKEEARVNKIVEEVSEKETKLDDAFQKAQQKFADENGMQIVPNEIQQEIDNM